MIVLSATQFRLVTGGTDLYLCIERECGEVVYIIAADRPGGFFVSKRSSYSGEQALYDRRADPERWVEEQPTLVTSQEFAEDGDMVPTIGVSLQSPADDLLGADEACCGDDPDRAPRLEFDFTDEEGDY